MKLQFTLLLLGAAATVAKVDYTVEYLTHLENFAEHRFPNDRYDDQHEEAREYIMKAFEKHGLRTQVQKFNISVNTDIIGINPEDKTVEGQNIIAIAEATSNKPEAVIVVGADYDTNGVDNPLFNNGAGVAVLLETVRLFMYNVRWSQAFRQNFTTVFVAFDLNTREHEGSAGKPGSYHFVNEWLWTFLNRSKVNFGGAYIIDSVMNVNQDVRSQIADSKFQQTFPTTYTSLSANDFKGNFLSMVTLNEEKSLKLKDQYSGKYNRERKKLPFRLEDMTLPKNLHPSLLMSEFKHQATFHFWTFQVDGTPISLPALLLTDTEKLRTIPVMEGCTKGCPPKMLVTEERTEFMESTTKALVQTLLARQAHPLPPTAGVLNCIPSLIMSIAMMFLVYILH